MYDWKVEIELWTKSKRKVIPFITDLIHFFELAFSNTYYPEKALFGTVESSISLLTGGIFFAAYTKEGSIWLLVDREFDGIPNTRCKIVKSTKSLESSLYWLETEDLNNLTYLTQNQEIWASFKRATHLVYGSKAATAYRAHIAKNKVSLADFYLVQKKEVTFKEIELELEEKLLKARHLSREKRLNILKNSEPKPRKKVVQQTVFERNEYVILEVLDRANGLCERCKKAAPFLRDQNQTPYLEVHHKIPLAEGGDDTIENAIALCPNCHRHAHYGKLSF